MAFEVGKREKIFVGVVALVFTIGALHFLLFAQQHERLKIAKMEYEDALADASKGRVPNDWRQRVEQYRAETEQIKQQYLDRMTAMRVVSATPGFYLPSPFWEGVLGLSSTTGQVAQYYPYPGEEQIAQVVLDQMKTLMQLKEQNSSINFSFLENYWRLPTQLPATYTRQGQRNLRDDITHLLELYELLRSTVRASDQAAVNAEIQRWQILESLTGTPAQDLQYTIPSEAGPKVLELKFLMHVDLIQQYLESQPGAQPIDERLLRQAFGVEVHPIDYFHIYNQLAGLIDIMQIAAQSGIQEMPYAMLLERKDKIFDEEWLKTPSADATPEEEEEEEVAGGYYGGGYGSYGGYGGGGTAQETPEEAGVTDVGDIMPIYFMLYGPNSSIVDCLYGITTAPAYYPIDQLTLRGSLPPSQGRVSGYVYADVTVNVLSDVHSEYFKIPSE